MKGFEIFHFTRNARGITFLGVFTKLRKAITSFVKSVFPSVGPHATTLLPLDGFA